jgi:hypothetical protein
VVQALHFFVAKLRERQTRFEQDEYVVPYICRVRPATYIYIPTHT